MGTRLCIIAGGAAFVWTASLVAGGATTTINQTSAAATAPPCALLSTTPDASSADCIDGEMWSAKTGCVACGIGLVPDAAGKACVPCRAAVGQVSNRTSGASSCNVCPAGTWAFSKAFVDGTVVAYPAQSIPAPGDDAAGAVVVLISECLQCPRGRWARAGDTGVDMVFNQTHTYNSTDIEPCRLCEDGLIASDSRTHCVACEPGTAAASGASECHPCGNGTYAPYSRMGRCVTCPPGTTSRVVTTVESGSNGGQDESGNGNQSAGSNGTGSGEGTSVVVVDGGTGTGVGPGAGTGVDSGPGAGTGTDTGIVVGDIGVGIATVGSIGATTTTPVPQLSSSNYYGASVCVACEPGWFGGLTLGTCSPCPAGQFSAAASQTKCSQCAAGYFSQAAGSSVCTPCRAGRVSNVSGRGMSAASLVCRHVLRPWPRGSDLDAE